MPLENQLLTLVLILSENWIEVQAKAKIKLRDEWATKKLNEKMANSLRMLIIIDCIKTFYTVYLCINEAFS